jgi:hypothetical protein
MHVLAAVAEFERSVIRERINAGLAAARERGTILGRPRTLHRHKSAVAKLSRKGLSGRKIAAKLNIPPGSVFAVLKASKHSADERLGEQPFAPTAGAGQIRRHSSNRDVCCGIRTEGGLKGGTLRRLAAVAPLPICALLAATRPRRLAWFSGVASILGQGRSPANRSCPVPSTSQEVFRLHRLAATAYELCNLAHLRPTGLSRLSSSPKCARVSQRWASSVAPPVLATLLFPV